MDKIFPGMHLSITDGNGLTLQHYDFTIFCVARFHKNLSNVKISDATDKKTQPF